MGVRWVDSDNTRDPAVVDDASTWLLLSFLLAFLVPLALGLS